MFNERWYQKEAEDCTWDFLMQTQPGRNPLVCMPTGTGKSVVIAKFIKRAMFTFPNTRFIMATHVKELVEQNAERLQSIWPAAPVGIYSAGLKSRDTAHPIIFGGIQSMVSNPAAFGSRSIVIVDEAHLVPPNDETMYQKFFNSLRQQNDRLRIAGFTATPFRTGTGLLYGEGQMFTDVAYDITGVEKFNQLIAEKWLAPLVPKLTQTRLNVDGVRETQGDYNLKELEAAVDKEAITRAAIAEAVELGNNRRSWLVFATGKNHCEHVADMLRSFGISAVAVHSGIKAKERDARIKAYKEGHVRAIVNFNVLTTGFDDPKTDLIVMLRPTQSPGLWVQMLGRGTRPSPGTGKRDCMVLDFAHNVVRLGPINDPIMPKKKRKGSSGGPSAPVRIKVCRYDNTTQSEENIALGKRHGCGTINHVQARFCINHECESEFTQAVKIGAEASTVALIRENEGPPEPIIKTYDVRFVFYSSHPSRDGACLKVSYTVEQCINPIREFVHLESATQVGKARQWWYDHHNSEPPSTVQQALEIQSYLRKPKTIRVLENTKSGYPEVLARVY